MGGKKEREREGDVYTYICIHIEREGKSGRARGGKREGKKEIGGERKIDIERERER